VLEAGVREKQHLAQALHDGLAQQLTGIAFLLRTLAEDLYDAGRPEAETAEQVIQLVQEAIGQTSHLAHDVYPAYLQSGRLGAALRELAAHVEERHETTSVLEIDLDVRISDQDMMMYLYQFAHEAVTQALRRKPSKVVIHLKPLNDLACLCIGDNGNQPAKSGSGGNGRDSELWNRELITLKYRANLIGARLKVEPEADGGTVVSCIFDPHATPVV
jgi:signal transduction histidine kinase